MDFDLVFELVVFPTDFATETYRLCTFIGDNWFARGQPIAGMCENEYKLGAMYEARRAQWRRKQKREGSASESPFSRWFSRN